MYFVFQKEIFVVWFQEMLLCGTSYNSHSNSTSVCITAPFKKKRYYLCDWRIPENIFQIEQSALGYCLAALWCVLCGLWGREKKDTGVEGAGKGWDKKKRKETGISKKSEIVSNQQCLQQIHAEVSRISRALASSAAFRNHEWCPHYHCKEHLQANKHENGQVYRWKQELILI